MRHYEHAGRLFAYGPYTREIDIWADLFGRVTIAAPFRHGPPPADCIPFTRSNIAIAPQTDVGGDTWQAKVRLAIALPSLLIGLSRAMARADAIHVRGPGSFGLLGVLLAPLFSRRLVAKYAGQWNGFEGESWSGRAERFLLRSRWWRGPVLVYGDWPGEPDHIVPFFTSMMTSSQVEHATVVAERKTIGAPLRVLFSGMLEPRKRVDALLDGVKRAVTSGVPLEMVIVGDGSERARLERRARDLGIAALVRFVGAQPFDHALQWYEWAHCLVLPSRHSEGWPKVIAEAMSYGVLCIAVAHGQVSSMLRHGGMLLREGSAEEIGDALIAIARRPDAFQPAARTAAAWARQYSLEGLRRAIAEVLTERWKTPVGVECGQLEVSA